MNFSALNTRPKYLLIGAVLAALLQTGILYAGIEKRARVLRTGKEVTLLTQPVDPRDLMRGAYVVLGYDISNIERDRIAGVNEAEGHTVYVALKPGDNGLWQFSRAAFAPIQDLAADEVQIQGTSRYAISDDKGALIRLDYGIERYYVPEGTGKAIEDVQDEARISVVLAVRSDGVAVIKSLRDKGVALFDEPLY